MVLGRAAHYLFDAVLFSTVLAGVKRASGLSPDTSLINDDTTRNVADKFLGVGETIFNTLQAAAVNSSYFKKDGGAK